MQLYHSIATLKTSYYTIYLPIALAMVLAGFDRENDLWIHFHGIALKIRTFLQIQDVYFDCFADKEKSGKEGSYIQEGKCSWLHANALDLSDPRQKKILVANYGMPVIENGLHVKELYLELGIPNEFLKVQQEMTTDILEFIDKINNPKLKVVLEQTFKQTFQRICSNTFEFIVTSYEKFLHWQDY